eukprot:3807207-Heterocapsa_arctica.AAC.1
MVEGALAVPLRDIQEIILLDVALIISNASNGRGQSLARQLSAPSTGPPSASSPSYSAYELDDGGARRRISRKLHLRWRHAPTLTWVRTLRTAGLPEEILDPIPSN